MADTCTLESVDMVVGDTDELRGLTSFKAVSDLEQ